MKIRLFFLFLVIMSGNALAENALFSIQIAATKARTLDFYTQTTDFVSLYSEETSFGLLRIKLGSYYNREEAEKSLVAIKRKGFPDAFITAYTRDSGSISTSQEEHISEQTETISVNTPDLQNTITPSSLPAWSRMTEEQRKNIVYLDGVLHVNEGGKFIPISKY